jgi:chemotaxis protein MotB
MVLLGAVALASLTMGGCGKGRELSYAKVQIAELERLNAELEARNAQLEAELASRGGVPGTAAAPTPSGDWDITNRDKDIVVTLANDILFRPGSAVLTDKAKTTLNQLISEIQSKYPGNDVRVEGHTDDDPIKKSKDKWEDNWDLAGGRSRAVLHYLEDHGIASKSLGFAGYADQRPRTPGDKPRNRRVEIVIITNSR